MRISLRRARFAPAIVASLAASFVFWASPALAGTNNFYSSQFGGGETAAKSFLPGAVVVGASGNVFVADAEHAVVDEFDASGGGKPLREFTGDGTAAEGFYSEGIAVNAGGDLFVADPEREVVYEFEPDGNLLREITGGKTSAESFYPYAVAVNASGDLYVGDDEHGVVDEFEPAAYESATTGKPTEVLAASEPYHLAVAASSGDLYVTGSEAGVAVLHEFEPNGTLLSFTGSGTPQGSSFAPEAVAVAPSGEVYVADNANHVVDRFSATGSYLSQFEGSETPQLAFAYISGLAVNSSGEVYVADETNQVVDIYTAPEAEPVFTNFYSSQFGGGETAAKSFLPGAVVVGASGMNMRWSMSSTRLVVASRCENLLVMVRRRKGSIRKGSR